MRGRKVALAAVLALVFMFGAFPGFALAEEELSGGQYMTVVDEQGKVIMQTGIRVIKGDEYIAANNNRYRIVKTEGLKAYAKFIGKDKPPAALGYQPQALFPSRATNLDLALANRQIIGIYHTHDDESYTPTDGKDSIRGNGGIFKVGSALASALKREKVSVIHDMSRHDPHDVNAYHRSRRTATRLLRKGAVALIDVHRDAAPASAYQAKVSGQNVTKVKLVVGRSNPKMATNLNFARQLKAHIDKNHPGLSAGIFIGHGSYNQDLSSRAMLIEVGADRNSRQSAENAVRLLSSSIPEVLGISTAGGKAGEGSKPTGQLTANKTESRSNYTTAIIIAVIVALAVGAFALLNRGGVKR